MRAVWLLVLTACWTGSSPEPNEPVPVIAPPADVRPVRMRVKLERTPCLGRCPVFTVVVHGDGRLEWTGIENVAVVGRREGPRVPRSALDRLARQIDSAQFFDRDQYGELQQGPVCTTTGGTTTCSYSAHFCSDTSHAKLTVTRSGRTHAIDNDHCDPKPGIDDIEDAIENLAGMAELIGR